jgi:hypothetical protein
MMAEEPTNSDEERARRADAIQAMIKKLVDPMNTGKPIKRTGPRYSSEESRRRADAIYAKIKHLVNPGNDGKFLSIDIESGEYEVSERYGESADRLFNRLPDPQIFTYCIGYETTLTFCGSLKRIASLA